MIQVVVEADPSLLQQVVYQRNDVLRLETQL
jgi:hypothetical protein